MGWIPKWGCLWMAFPSVSVPFFVHVFPLDRYVSGLKNLRWVDDTIPQLGALLIYWIHLIGLHFDGLTTYIYFRSKVVALYRDSDCTPNPAF